MKLDQKVYEVLKQIPEGRVTTYKAIAERLNTKAYQAIGQACRRNPNAPDVPCHRVVSSNGSIGGYSGKKSGPNIKKKISLLKKEGVKIKDGKIVDFEEVFWS